LSLGHHHSGDDCVNTISRSMVSPLSDTRTTFRFIPRG
jgi:hypothetical protein